MDLLSTETKTLLAKVAALRLLSGNTVDVDASVAKWAQAELDSSEWMVVRSSEWNEAYSWQDPLASHSPGEGSSAITPLEWVRLSDGPSIPLWNKTQVKLWYRWHPVQTPEPEVPSNGPRVVQEDVGNFEVAPTVADQSPAKPIVPTRTRRTKAEMAVVRQKIQEAYADKLLAAREAGFGWETAHNEALVYVDALGTEAAINLSPSQVRQAVAVVVDTYKREYENPGSTTVVVKSVEVQDVAPEPVSDKAAQIQRNVDLINQGINPRTGQPLPGMAAPASPPLPDDDDVAEDEFDKFLKGE